MKQKFVIIGRIIHGIHFIKELRRLGFPKPLVVCSLDDEYLRDRRLLSKYGLWANLEAIEQEGLCDLVKLGSINTSKALELFSINKCTVAFSINARDIIKKPVIDYFGGEIYNLHDSFLPNERGGALNTWRILNGITSVGNTIHYLNEGVDSGPVILRKRVAVTEVGALPIDYLLAEVSNCAELLTEFAEILAHNEFVPRIEQDHDLSLYFSRQFTELNGLVNWDWEITEIERFIRAFSYPYPGAYSYYREEKVHVLEAEIDQEMIGEKFHPHCNGRVVTILRNGSARIIAGGRALIIKKIAIGDEVIVPSDKLEIKHLFHSSHQALNDARIAIPTTKLMAQYEIERNQLAQ